MRIFLLLLVSSFHLSGYDFEHPKYELIQKALAKKKKKPAAKKGAAKKGEPEPEEKPKDTGEPNLLNELWDIHRGEAHEYRQQ